MKTLEELNEHVSALDATVRRLVGVEVSMGMPADELAYVMGPLESWAEGCHDRFAEVVAAMKAAEVPATVVVGWGNDEAAAAMSSAGMMGQTSMAALKQQLVGRLGPSGTRIASFKDECEACDAPEGTATP